MLFMKHLFVRHNRRLARGLKHTFFRNHSNEQSFFSGEPSHESFFQPANTNTAAVAQRKCEQCEQEEKHLNKKDQTTEENKLQKKEASSPNSATKNITANYIGSLNGKGQSLPKQQQYFFGSRMGHDFSHVKIHHDKEAASSAKEINAKAYTVNNHIVFNKGEYDPTKNEGKRLLAHELAHVMQNNNGESIKRKVRDTENEEETPFIMNGSYTNVKNKTVHGHCEGVDVHGQTDFNPVPSTFAVNGGSTRSATACEACTPADCITANGTIVSVFKSNPTVTLPPVPSGLAPCETHAVTVFINTTLRSHEQQHVAAFKTYDGKVSTPLHYKGCRTDLQAYVQSVHDGIDAQRSAAAIAKSDALDPFVRPIPCKCP
jgi:hypothetical protein